MPSFPLVVDLSTLTAADGFIIQGDVAGDRAGISVASAGDVNGDGIADVIVGAYLGDNGGGNAGEAYVIYGAPGGLSNIDLSALTAAQGFIIQGDALADFAGYSVASAGDVNGDGIDDLIVGANGGDNGGANAGEAYVIYGAVGGLANIDLSTLTAAQGFIIQGDAAEDGAGGSVSSAGDVNGDGLADLIVGAPFSDNGGVDAGEAYVIYGAPGGLPNIDLSALTAAQGFIIQGDAGGDSAGWSVASAGDVNGDGLADLIVGAYSGDNGGFGAGEAYVIYGAVGGLSNIDLSALTNAQGFIIQGDVAVDQAGRSVASAGDINGDGIDDLIVGAPFGDNGGGDAGEAYVIYGAVGGLADVDLTTLTAAQGFIIQGDTLGGQAGWSVASAGDVNGDGIADLIFGAPFADNSGGTTGEAYVIFGALGGLPNIDLSILTTAQGFIIQGHAFAVRAGWSVAGAGDVNGDGIDDLIVGAPLGDNGGGDAGEAYVIYGRASTVANDDVYLGDVDGLVTHDNIFTPFFNDGAGSFANGTSGPTATLTADVALADLDGDGDLDLYRARQNGNADQILINDGAGGFTDSGQAIGSADSRAVALGDLDGDGDLDAYVASFGFLVSAADAVYLNNGGGIFTDSGQAIGADNSLDVALGDVDGDGDLDAVVATNGGNRIYLNDGAGAFTSNGQSLGGQVSTAVALADFDGDGDLDAFFGNSNNTNGGALYLNDGAGTFSIVTQTLPGGTTTAVAVGDVDFDGDIDVLLTKSSTTNGQFDSVLLNDGAGLFTTTSVIPGIKRPTQDAELADVDGDGDLDAILTYGNTADTRLFLNDGAGTFTEALSFGENNTADLALGDLDHDGFSEDAVQVLRVLDNDTDAQGDVLTISAVDATSANGAALSISNGGRTVTYDPTAAAAIQALGAGATLDDTFSYTVSDGNGGVDIATVTIRIAGAAEPDLFTTGNDTVDLNAYDLSLYALSQVNDALAGDDDVILSSSQNTGQYFDGNAGDDTITGSAAVDNVNGGTGADEIHLAGGDDTIHLHAGEAAPGEILDGGADFDTLSIDGGGAVDLTGVTLTDIDNIELTSGASTTLSGIAATHAALISNAVGTNDIVQIASGSVSEALVADLILDAGVERVEWSIPGFASAVEAVPDGLGGFIISYDDGDDVQPWDTIDAQYDSLGRKISQTNDYDFPGPEGGVTLNFTYDPVTGDATTIVNTDGHLTRTFSTITTTLENGVVTKVDTINDNNTASNADDTLVEQFFTAGVITLERTTDTSSANAGKPWLYQDREYVNDGVLHTTTQVFRTFWDTGVNGGGQHVVGAAGAQVIEGVATGGGVSTTNDALIGGAGADTFRFVPGFGHDTIYDFADGTDLLDLSSYAAGIDTLAELQNAASITQVAFGAGFNTVIAFNGTGDQITIRNFTVAQLDNGDFAV